MPTSDLGERLFASLMKQRHLERFAVRALLKANDLLGLALGARLAEIRDSGEPIQAVFAQSEANAIQARLFHELALILGERWDKIPDRKRPQYTPEQRYRILRIRRLLALSARETACRFRVSPSTVSRWETEGSADSDDESRKPLVRTAPPIRRYADVVRQLVHSIKLAGFGGYETIAQTLTGAGWRLSKRTVGRILREQPPSGNPTDIEAPKALAVRPRYPNHIAFIDVTEIPGLFGLWRFKLAVVLDGFSRFPLAARVFLQEPTAQSILQLFETAIERFATPRHLVTDQGSQFMAKEFIDRIKVLGVLHRFGAIGKTGSIALIERLWRTLKHQLALKVFKPLVADELEQRLALGLHYYAFLRPHQGLTGATPAEIYFGQKPLSHHAIPPPRGRPGEPVRVSRIQIHYLDPEQRLPFLKTNAA